MASLDYIDIPPGATRLRSQTISHSTEDPSSDIRPAPKMVTSLPHPSPPSSPSVSRYRTTSMSSIASSGLTSPTLSFLPQLLLSSSLPASATNPTQSPIPRKKQDNGKPILLSSRDSLSLPIMTSNFKRFVAKVGPVFWLQDRIEEILLWKRGWKVTTIWMAAYAFLCYFPRLILLIPHLTLIGIILATYHYPEPTPDAIYSSNSISGTGGDASSSRPPPAAPPPSTEGSVDWQANILAIQNLMGLYADTYAIVMPYLSHLSLGPLQVFASPTTLTAPHPALRPTYTPHILTLLLLTFPPLLFIISLPAFPVRAVCLFLGLAPLVATHPQVRAFIPFISPLVQRMTPVVLEKLEVVKANVAPIISRFRSIAVPASKSQKLHSNPTSNLLFAGLGKLPISTVTQRLIDDDRLSDECWNAEMREVELWENERYGGPPDSSMPVPAPSAGLPQRGWSKQNLKPTERSAWTRGRDGWSAVGGAAASGSTVEGPEGDSMGEVSSNLTFSLAPGWSFVDTEDWRKDLVGSWVECGADEDGWVYTNDVWLGVRPAPYTAGTGSLTRRRRWARRVWYDPARAGTES